MKRSIFFVIAVFLFAFSFSCKDNKISDKNTTDSLSRQLNLLEDSVKQAWTVLDNNYDSMFISTSRLADEVSYNGSNKRNADQIKNYVSQLKSERLTQQMMKTSENIDVFDKKVDSLV